MEKLLGLILLVIAVAAAVYLASNDGSFLKLKFDLPAGMAPGTLSSEFPPSDSLANQQNYGPADNNSPIIVSSIRPQTPYEYGEMVLSPSWNIGSAGVDIRGWKIRTLGNEFTIPGAQEVYTFGGSLNSLVVRPGDEVHLFSGSSPKGNFRINKCIGYFSEYANFTPPIERACPTISPEETYYLTSSCRSYVASLSACEIPRSPNVSFNDNSCYEFLNTINYEGCVSRHRSDADFLDRKVWVWIGDNMRYFNPEGGVIYIYDKSDKMMAEYRY